jgi:hypothetical protein
MGILSDVTKLKDSVRELCALHKDLGKNLERQLNLSNQFQDKDFIGKVKKQQTLINQIDRKIEALEEIIF